MKVIKLRKTQNFLKKKPRGSGFLPKNSFLEGHKELLTGFESGGKGLSLSASKSNKILLNKKSIQKRINLTNFRQSLQSQVPLGSVIRSVNSVHKGSRGSLSVLLKEKKPLSVVEGHINSNSVIKPIRLRPTVNRFFEPTWVQWLVIDHSGFFQRKQEEIGKMNISLKPKKKTKEHTVSPLGLRPSLKGDVFCLAEVSAHCVSTQNP